MASQHIRICLFFIELSFALGISSLTLVLLNVLQCGSWSVKLSSTFALLWIVKAVANFFFSESQHDVRKGADVAAGDKRQNVLRNYESREQQRDIPIGKHDGPEVPYKQSAMMEETKLFLKESEGHDHAKISFNLISILVTVCFQLAIRLIVIFQNVTLTFQRRRRQAALGNGSKSVFNIPFTIGRRLSPSGCSFYIFSFLNNFLGEEGFNADDDDDDLALKVKALSFDNISTNSSSILIRNIRKHSTIGICFGDIELTFTLLLKRRRKERDVATPFIRSITIRIRVDSCSVGLFPRIFDWVECNGVEIDVSASIESKNKVEMNCIAVCLRLGQLNFYQVASSLGKIISWGKLDIACEANSQRTTVAILALPSGFAAVSRQTGSHINRTDGLIVPKRSAVISLGNNHENNRIAAGINAKEVSTLVQNLKFHMGNILSCLDKYSLGSRQVAVSNASNVKTPYLMEICVMSNAHIYSILSSPQNEYEILSLRLRCLSIGLGGEEILDDRCYKSGDLFRCCIGSVALGNEAIDERSSRLDILKTKCIVSSLKHYCGVSESQSRCVMIVDVDGMGVRVDAKDIAKLSSYLKLVNEVKYGIIGLQDECRQTDFKGMLKPQAKIARQKRNDLDRIEVSMNNVDAVVELSARIDREGQISSNDDRIRFTVLTRKAIVNIMRRTSSRTSESSDYISKGTRPRELFGSRLQRYGASFFIDVVASCFEASVTYSPHTSLPVFDENNCHQSQELSYYAQANTFGLETIIPTKTTSLTKSMLITFNEIFISELTQFGNNVVSIFATSVHKLHFNLNESRWSLMNSYEEVNSFHITNILQGTGEFCLVESMIRVENDVTKEEIISVRLRRGKSDVDLTWSPIFQWTQMSFNKRLQAALSHLRNLMVSGENRSSITFPSRHSTRVYVNVDSDVTANMNLYVGAKTTSLLRICGGCEVEVAITKYPSPHRPIQLKPNISLRAQHIEVYLNGIRSPILISDCFVFQNTIRRAFEEEIEEYLCKKEVRPGNWCISDEIVTDKDGHPLKENFYLNIGSCATVQVPPTLFLGDVIDDFNLLPKSLDIGTNSLKEDGGIVRRKRKYQLLTIECTIPSLSISLLDVDVGAESFRLREEVSLFIEDGKLLIERNSPPELTQQILNDIDEDKTARYNYGPVVQGGELKLSICQLMFNVHPMNIAAPMVRIANFSIAGCLFLAGLSPTTPGMREGRRITSTLLCHHQGNCCCPYGISIDNSEVPVKLYTDSRIHCDELDVNYGPVLNPSIPRLNECIKRLLPSPKDNGAQEPLTWWDNIRFAVHGPIVLFVNRLSFRWLLDSHILIDQAIFLTCKDCELGYKKEISLDAINIDVSMPGVPYDTSVHPSERDLRTNDSFLPHEMESMVGKGRHPLLFVPSLSTRMSFSWKMKHSGRLSCQHHSIYLDYKDKDTDKFSLFRSDGFDVNLSFDLLGASGDGVVCNWVALRIDVLPWFTHINSTVDYSLERDDDRQDPIPRFLSLAMNLNMSQLKIAAWYEEVGDAEGDDSGGLCLIVPQVVYNAYLGGEKEIIVGGPIKAARLNVSGFAQADNDDESEFISEMAGIEVIARGFGSDFETELCINDPQSMFDEKDTYGVTTPFSRLEQLSSDIDELDYIVTSGQIDVFNKSLAKIIGSEERESESIGDEQIYADLDRTTWSILVSRLRILWTLDIRDCIMSISKDLIFQIGYMKSQVRYVHALADKSATSSNGRHLSTTPMNLNKTFDFSTGQPMKEHSGDGLQYLLRRESSHGLYSDVTGTQGQGSDQSTQQCEDEDTLPTLDIHFSNPQVQLHSKSTGGSVILAMEGAHVEGKKFVKFLVSGSHSGLISPADLIRRTEHIYTLTNMEAYSLNSHVDVNIGLSWLEVDIPIPAEPILSEKARQLGVLFGISSPRQSDLDNSERNDSVSLDCEVASGVDEYEWKYPPELRHHEPLSFQQQNNIRPILKKCTCSSRQLFNRPPIHHSNEELKTIISQGLFIELSEYVADDIDLEIDLLQFNLDAYQFKTTIDLIRNVLLKAPKLHRRSQNFIKVDDEEETGNAANRISSPAVFEMESAMWAARARRASGKKERAALRAPAMMLIADLENRMALYGDQMIRRISYKLSKLVWSVQSQGQEDDVQIAFTGFEGKHSYMASGSLKTQISLEDVRIASSTPGPDAIGFPDPTSVLKPVLGSKRSPCQRCGSIFSHSNNGLEACWYHSGRFSAGKWTCCRATSSDAVGCKSAPHTGKERTAVVRVETLPPVVEGISLYSHIEVNIFPMVQHTLRVQVSKSVSRLLMDYFFIDQDDVDDDDEDDVQSISTDLTGSTDTITVRSDMTPVRKKSVLIGGKGISGQSIKEEISLSESYDLDALQQQRTEIFFVKVLRVGNVNVEVSLGGFRALPQTRLSICVREYSRAYKIGSPTYLVQKYLYYLIHEVLKSGASSALRRKKMTTSAVVVNAEENQEDTRIERKSKTITSPSWMSRRSSAAQSRAIGVQDIIGTPLRKSAKKKKKRLFR